jgi:dCMP deaminase
MDHWNDAFLRQAIHLAATSPDPRTQNGAILVNRHGRIIGSGVNEPLPGMSKPGRWEYPAKGFYVEHAERRAIFEAVRMGCVIEWGTLYCPWFACADCARAIVGTGVSRVVGLAASAHGRWRDTCEAGDNILLEGNVAVVRVPAVTYQGVILRRDGLELLL